MNNHTNIITRFAPSPSGNLHLGGARTALYCYLYAKKNNGKFILRIEDTDKTRSKQEYVENIMDSLKWLGMQWDGQVLYQSQHLEHYQQAIKTLLDTGKAYRCYCSEETLQKQKEQAIQNNQPYRYSGHCREFIGKNLDKPHTIRFKLPDPQEQSVVFFDMIRGKIETPLAALDDFIIARTDGSAVYNLAVVVDDILSDITHIIRGDDHINNTPKQVLLWKALNRKPAKFAHLPLIMGPDKKRLSKRHGALSVLEYQKQGIISEAMNNFLARIGWSAGNQEIFSTDQLLEKFSLKQVGSSQGIYDYNKLLWINQQHLKTMDIMDVVERWKPFLLEAEYSKAVIDSKNLPLIAEGLRKRCSTLKEMAEKGRYFFVEELHIDENLWNQHISNDFQNNIKDYIPYLEELKEFKEKTIEQATNAFLEEHKIPLKEIAQGLRIKLSGEKVTPGLFELMEGIGKEWVIQRLKKEKP